MLHKTHYATHITAGWVLETCRVYVGEPSSSHLETSLQEAYPLVKGWGVGCLSMLQLLLLLAILLLSSC